MFVSIWAPTCAVNVKLDKLHMYTYTYTIITFAPYRRSVITGEQPSLEDRGTYDRVMLNTLPSWRNSMRICLPDSHRHFHTAVHLDCACGRTPNLDDLLSNFFIIFGAGRTLPNPNFWRFAPTLICFSFNHNRGRPQESSQHLHRKLRHPQHIVVRTFLGRNLLLLESLVTVTRWFVLPSFTWVDKTPVFMKTQWFSLYPVWH